jgi:hypothetical protein
VIFYASFRGYAHAFADSLVYLTCVAAILVVTVRLIPEIFTQCDGRLVAIFGMMSGMRVRRFLPIAVVATAAAAAVVVLSVPSSGPSSSSVQLTSASGVSGVTPGSTIPGTGEPGVSPAGGVHTRYFCGSQWKNVRPGGGTGYNIYNDNFGAKTCLVNTDNAGFGISYSAVRGGYEAFPNIPSGWEWGVNPMHGYTYPVQYRRDGHARTSVSVRLVNSGTYNAAYDMWFSTYRQTNGQNNAAEVMIWLSCRNNCIGWRPVTIEGVRFLETQWIAYHNGVHWHYTAFVARTHRSYFNNLWLNPFFHVAGVNPNWYLTSIDFGFELVDGGYGLRVNNYSLTGVS